MGPSSERLSCKPVHINVLLDASISVVCLAFSLSQRSFKVRAVCVFRSDAEHEAGGSAVKKTGGCKDTGVRLASTQFIRPSSVIVHPNSKRTTLSPLCHSIRMSPHPPPLITVSYTDLFNPPPPPYLWMTSCFFGGGVEPCWLPPALHRKVTARFIVRVLTQATITVEALHEGIDFSLALTRAKFEELNQDLFKKTLDVRIHLRDPTAVSFSACGIYCLPTHCLCFAYVVEECWKFSPQQSGISATLWRLIF